MAKRKPRAFTKEFKAQAVRIVRESGKSVTAVARELDPVTVQDSNTVLTQCHIDADKPLCHGTPFARRRGTARISRTGATCRKVSMAWSNVRDGGEPSPSILDECSRPGGRGATFSVDGCSHRSAEVPVHQSSFPSCLRTDFNRTLLLATRGIATTLAGTLRS